MVELRGIEPLTPSLRTRGSVEVNTIALLTVLYVSLLLFSSERLLDIMYYNTI